MLDGPFNLFVSTVLLMLLMLGTISFKCFYLLRLFPTSYLSNKLVQILYPGKLFMVVVLSQASGC